MKTYDTILPQISALTLCALHFALCVSLAWAIRPYTPVHPDPVLEPWRWRSFPALNGLGLQCMAEAKDKSIWFGVDDGVRRYDGVHWTAYTEKDGLYGAPVVTLLGSRDGSVYAGTAMGISRFWEGKWRRVFPPEGDPSTLRQAQGSGQALPWLIYDLMEARDGSVWAGTGWGALRLSQDEWTLYTTEQMGAALRALAPYVRLFIVPEEVAPARPWPEGIGAAITVGLQRFGTAFRVSRVIYALVSGGPGEAAGLKVGDRIVATDGQPDVNTFRVNGPAGTSVRLTIQREGRPGPFEVTVTRKKVEGTFRRFSIFDVFEDREGAIWFGLSGPEGGEIVRYAPSALPGVQRSLSPYSPVGGVRRGALCGGIGPGGSPAGLRDGPVDNLQGSEFSVRDVRRGAVVCVPRQQRRAL
ncbi:MAG: hypothetical protein A3F84_09050 [Candidatus Handelsmanbacteria bacterium RIFCSPLOWO2_12_FULL_64_10]|uniref:PDZ domain-containing protein n=1 Tax=Handelsmanbacteria sp. (strain RIFCSPLOWO2_12_FULL_64_10) TaxID=1817868 RepID=A0A1F6CYW9_HANXR|nr:MAG: hypothetical protein A3F84_09050 [Candidatus Handelsmanbacteria bacterium RIFCSPLOWO2_12_FULL_64_10]